MRPVRAPLALLFLATALSAQPLQNRLMLAISDDGLRFMKLHRVIFNEADVPDAVVTETGAVYLYFQGNLPPARDAIVVGVSPDGISGWTFQPVSITGIGAWKVRPCDPDVLYRDGRFRLYMTGDPTDDRVPESYSAVSDDGIHFTLENGARFSGGSRPVLDPSLVWIGDTLHYFAGGGAPDRNWHAVSADGLTFASRPDFGVGGMMMSNGISVPGGHRFYGFTNRPPSDIRSIFSTDGASWTQDPGPRLEVETNDTLESAYVKDPAIVLRDRTYLMYYVTRKPEFTGSSGGAVPDASPLHLAANHPNPFTTATRIPFAIAQRGRVTLEVHDALGRHVATLLDAEISPGSHTATFRAQGLPCGIYYAVLRSASARVRRLMILAR